MGRRLHKSPSPLFHLSLGDGQYNSTSLKYSTSVDILYIEANHADHEYSLVTNGYSIHASSKKHMHFYLYMFGSFTLNIAIEILLMITLTCKHANA